MKVAIYFRVSTADQNQDLQLRELQDYATRHPDQLYIVYNDAPKVVHLKQQFPELYIGR